MTEFEDLMPDIIHLYEISRIPKKKFGPLMNYSTRDFLMESLMKP
jgi:hypothetical protein